MNKIEHMLKIRMTILLIVLIGLASMPLGNILCLPRAPHALSAGEAVYDHVNPYLAQPALLPDGAVEPPDSGNHSYHLLPNQHCHLVGEADDPPYPGDQARLGQPTHLTDTVDYDQPALTAGGAGCTPDTYADKADHVLPTQHALRAGGAGDPRDQGDYVADQQLDKGIQNSVCLTISISIEDFNFLARYKYGNRNGSGLKLCHWNKGSSFLENSMTEIEQIVAEYKPHILGISESNFYSYQNLEDVQINDYKLYLADTLNNAELNISRVAVYVHKDIVVKVRHDLMTDSFSSIWLEVGLRRQKNFLVCNIYREWQHVNQVNQDSGSIVAQLARWESFLQKWEVAIAAELEVHVLGDMNLNYFRFQSSPQSNHSSRLRPLINQLLDRIVPHGFSQLVTVETRIWANQEPSLLDHFWSNKPEKLRGVHAFYQAASDHKMIFAVRHTKGETSKPRITRKRCYKNFKPEEFISAVKKISWFDAYMTEDVEEAVLIVTEKLTTILNEMAPVKYIQSRAKFAPWLSKETKDKIKARNNSQKIASESNLKEDWDEFKRQRNEINNILKSEKRSWQENKIKTFGSDTSSIWKNVKSWLGWTAGGPPSKLIENGSVFNKPSDLATIMNNFFINKIKNLRQNLPQNPGDPLLLVQKLMENRTCNFSLTAVHPDDVLKILGKLKGSSSTGIDDIDSNTLKLIKNEIYPVLTHIINLSISNKTFPHPWKQAKVIPLHKKNEVLYAKNYRPVSLLSVLSKVLERCIFVQVVDYLECNRLLHPSHHGFRSNHSTLSALVQMFDTWVEAFEDDEVSAVIMLDMSAAFDTVDHDILLKKMDLYGFDHTAISWFRSYMTNRSQSVSIEGFLSQPQHLECGVPQGSILGPLLYILYTNDLPEAVHGHVSDDEDQLEDQHRDFYNIKCKGCGGICLYADDSTFSISNKNVEKLNEDIDEKYKEIAQYMAKNRLILNSDKTQLLVMTSARRHRIHENYGISLDTGSEIIQPQSEGSLLGATVSNSLSWNSHIRDSKSSLLSCLNSRINGLAKVCQYSSFKTRKMVANGLFMSYLTYLIPLYGGCPEYLLSALQILQNRAARLATKSSWYTASAHMLQQLGWLSVHQMIVFHSLVLVFKTKMKQRPVYLYSQVSAQFSVQTRLSVSHGIRETRRTQSELGRKSFFPRSINQWNSLPADVRSEPSLGKFRMKLKSWVRQHF